MLYITFFWHSQWFLQLPLTVIRPLINKNALWSMESACQKLWMPLQHLESTSFAKPISFMSFLYAGYHIWSSLGTGPCQNLRNSVGGPPRTAILLVTSFDATPMSGINIACEIYFFGCPYDLLMFFKYRRIVTI